MKKLLIILSLVFIAGCATDSIMNVYRNEKGEVVKVEQKQRFWKYIPAVGKSESSDGKVTGKVDSSVLPDINVDKD